MMKGGLTRLWACAVGWALAGGLPARDVQVVQETESLQEPPSAIALSPQGSRAALGLPQEGPMEVNRSGGAPGPIFYTQRVGDPLPEEEVEPPRALPADLTAGGAGPVKRFQFSLGAGVLYDDNIYLSPREEVEDLIYRISPEVRLAWGDVLERERSFLLINYRPDVLIFHHTSEENTVEHAARVAGLRRFTRGAVGAEAGYRRLSDSTVDLSSRVARHVFDARVLLTYGWGARTSVDTALVWEAADYDDGRFADHQEAAHEIFVDYRFSDKTRAGLGISYGILDVEGQSRTQTFQRAMVRAETEATGRLTLDGRAGLELRQTAAGDDATPVFGLGLRYQAREGTLLTLDGEREVEASGSMEGLNYVRTSVRAGLRQRMGSRFVLQLEGGWEGYDYQAADARGRLQARSDDYFFVRPALVYDFRENIQAEAFYRWSTNDSSVEGGGFHHVQSGVNMKIDF